MRLFISCVKTDQKDVVDSKEMVYMNSSEETVGPWEALKDEESNDIPLHKLEEEKVEAEVNNSPLKDEAVASLVQASPITSVPQNIPVIQTVHQQKLGRFIIERHREIHATLKSPLLPEVLNADLGKKCLVLDLDETLIHSQFAPVPNSDLQVPIEVDKGKVLPIYVCKRPGVDAFLEAVGKYFEIVIFTASLASVLINISCANVFFIQTFLVC